MEADDNKNPFEINEENLNLDDHLDENKAKRKNVILAFVLLLILAGISVLIFILLKLNEEESKISNLIGEINCIYNIDTTLIMMESDLICANDYE